MKTFSLLLTMVFFCSASFALAIDKRTDAYRKKDGTYVRSHMRSTPDKIKTNNVISPSGVNKYKPVKNKPVKLKMK
jgi:hypothetical protein